MARVVAARALEASPAVCGKAVEAALRVLAVDWVRVTLLAALARAVGVLVRAVVPALARGRESAAVPAARVGPGRAERARAAALALAAVEPELAAAAELARAVEELVRVAPGLPVAAEQSRLESGSRHPRCFAALLLGV